MAAGSFTNLACPRCGSSLLSNGDFVWCSFIGDLQPGTACSYGIDVPILLDPSSLPPMPQPKSSPEAEAWADQVEDLDDGP